MLTVPGIDSLSPALFLGGPEPGRPRTAATEFDAMVWQLLLEHSGLLRPFTAEGDAPLPVVGEMFVHVFARQLAQQIDLGFGSLVLDQAQRLQQEEQQ